MKKYITAPLPHRDINDKMLSRFEPDDVITIITILEKTNPNYEFVQIQDGFAIMKLRSQLI